MWRGRQARIQVHCTRKSSGVKLGLIGSRRVEPILDRVSDAYGVMLALDRKDLPPAGPETLQRKLTISEIPGLEVYAAIARCDGLPFERRGR